MCGVRTTTLLSLLLVWCGRVGVRAAQVALEGPSTLEFVEGEPVVFELTFRNPGTQTAIVEAGDDHVSVTVKSIHSPKGSGVFVIKGRTEIREGFQGYAQLRIPPGEARSRRVYLGHWGAKLLPGGMYHVTVVFHEHSRFTDPTRDSPIYRYSAPLTITRDLDKLQQKLRKVAERALQAEREFLGPIEFPLELERYALPYSIETRLWLLETRWRGLERTRDSLLFSLMKSLIEDGIEDPEPVVRRLAALRNNTDVPGGLKAYMDELLAHLIPRRHMPKLVAAVKKHFGITLRAAEEEIEDHPAQRRDHTAPDGDRPAADEGTAEEELSAQGPAAPEGAPARGVEDKRPKPHFPWMLLGLACGGTAFVLAVVQIIRRRKNRHGRD